MPESRDSFSFKKLSADLLLRKVRDKDVKFFKWEDSAQITVELIHPWDKTSGQE